MKKLLWFVLIPLASTELCAGPVEQLEAFIKTDMHDKVVELITQKKVDVNCELRNGLSPLDWALSVGNRETINFLTERGARATGENLSSYDTGVYIPKTRTQPSAPAPHTARSVVQREHSPLSNLESAVLNDDASKAMECILAGASIEGHLGQELLRLAVNKNKFQIVTWLMEQGITLEAESVARPHQAKNSAATQKSAHRTADSLEPPLGPRSTDLPFRSFPYIGTLDSDDLQELIPFAEAMSKEVPIDLEEEAPAPGPYTRPVYEEVAPRASEDVRKQVQMRNALRMFQEILEGTEARIVGDRIPHEPAEQLRARAKEEVVERINTLAKREPVKARDLHREALSSSKSNVIAAFEKAGFPSPSHRSRRYTARRKRTTNPKEKTSQKITQEVNNECVKSMILAEPSEALIVQRIQELIEALTTGDHDVVIAKIKTIVEHEPHVANTLLRKVTDLKYAVLIKLLKGEGAVLNEQELTPSSRSATPGRNKRKAVLSQDVGKIGNAPKKIRSESSAAPWKQEVHEWTQLDWAYYNQDKAQIKKSKDMGEHTSVPQSEATALLSKYGFTGTIDFEKYYSEFIGWCAKLSDEIPLEFASEHFAQFYAERVTGGKEPLQRRHEVTQNWEKQQAFSERH